jgi:hypothetical protein
MVGIPKTTRTATVLMIVDTGERYVMPEASGNVDARPRLPESPVGSAGCVAMPVRLSVCEYAQCAQARSVVLIGVLLLCSGPPSIDAAIGTPPQPAIYWTMVSINT